MIVIVTVNTDFQTDPTAFAKSNFKGSQFESAIRYVNKSTIYIFDKYHLKLKPSEFNQNDFL